MESISLLNLSTITSKPCQKHNSFSHSPFLELLNLKEEAKIILYCKTQECYSVFTCRIVSWPKTVYKIKSNLKVSHIFACIS